MHLRYVVESSSLSKRIQTQKAERVVDFSEGFMGNIAAAAQNAPEEAKAAVKEGEGCADDEWDSD